MPQNSKLVFAGLLKHAISQILRSRGMTGQHADYVSDTLVTTSLWGIDTHGVELLTTYLKEIDGGGSCVQPQMVWAQSRSGIALLNADSSLGPVAGNVAIRKAIEIGKVNGIGAVAVKNSNHFGAAGYYSYLGAQAGMISFAFTNSDALVAAFNGDVPLNGTNPIAVAAPTASQPFLLDMATSQASFSKVKEFVQSGRLIPAEWISESGRVGARPVLKPLGGYKGQGLGLVVQILCCVLTGSAFDVKLQHLFEEPYSDGRGIGHFFICLDINGFLPLAEFTNRLSELLDLFRSTSTTSGDKVIVPGDKEGNIRESREARGIPINQDLWKVLEPFA